MSKAGRKLVAIMIWAGIGVLAGMQLGSMESPADPRDFGQVRQDQGRLEESGAPQKQTRLQTEAREASVSLQAEQQREEPEKPKFEPLPRDILLPETPKPPADVLADKTAGLLQQLSNQSIRWVVSMFGSITD